LYACPGELTTRESLERGTWTPLAGKRSGGDVACGLRRPF
jgi:hypothetical protein